jgi:putative hemolysin
MIVVVGITYLSLVIGELVPKRIGLNSAERIAVAFSPGMDSLAKINTPIVKLLTASTNFVLGILNIGASQELAVTEADVRDMIEQGTEVGIFNQVEEEMVKRVFQLGDRRVSTVMTYRTEIAWLDLEDPLDENLRKIRESGHSRFPVAEGDLEEMVGILLAKDLLARELDDQPVVLRDLLNPPFFLPEGLTILQVLERMRTERAQLALLIDEYGSITGLATLTDVLESIVGELPAGIREGLGGALLNFNQYYTINPERLWAALLFAAAAGIVAFLLVVAAERLALRGYRPSEEPA